MNVCVAGWYFHAPLIKVLASLKHPVVMVMHRYNCAPESAGLRWFHIPNVGLEFGCYDWYLKNEWPSGSALFLHDDNEITEAALDAIASMTVDQAFLFSSEADAAANGRAHGRAIFCSEKFLARLKADGGFWFSETACDGKPIPATTAGEPDYHNAGIQVFRAYLESLLKGEFSVGHVAIVPGLKTGYRGRL
jgi:hypothetical protein